MSTTDLRGPAADTSSWTHLTLDRRSATYWRVRFDHPPINTITATTVAELAELVDLIEHAPALNVVVFDSANPDFFLAHYDTENDPARTAAMPAGPTGMHPWLDLIGAPVARAGGQHRAIRGRARGAGSEFVLACDLRFAARENTLLGQFEVGPGSSRRRPDGAALAAGRRGRRSEILLVADDLDGPRAELYGYVNRRSPTTRSTPRSTRSPRGSRASTTRRSRARSATSTGRRCPSDDELGPALPDFFAAFGRPGPQARQARLDRARAEHRRRPRARPRPARGRGIARHDVLTTTKGARHGCHHRPAVERDGEPDAGRVERLGDDPCAHREGRRPRPGATRCPTRSTRRARRARRRRRHDDARTGGACPLNVEVIGGSMIVQHYVEEIGEPDHLRLVSHSDLFTPPGRTKIDVVWDLAVRRIDDATCELTNTVHSSAPPEMQEFIARQGLAFDAFAAARRPNSEAHNRQETPEFAKSIERHALGTAHG
jgi:enoyl-CoA hydratase/carnithine racemase